jgi:hypothetical protein
MAPLSMQIWQPFLSHVELIYDTDKGTFFYCVTNMPHKLFNYLKKR